MAGTHVNEWVSQWVMGWYPSIRQRQEDRESGEERQKIRKQTDAETKLLIAESNPVWSVLIWLELKSAVTLVCLNAFTSSGSDRMSEQEERMTGTIAQACSQRGNLTMTLLLKLACYAEPHTCTVQTLRSVQSVQNKLPSPTSPPTSPTHRSANPEKKENLLNKTTYTPSRPVKTKDNGKEIELTIWSAQENMDKNKGTFKYIRGS